MEQEIWKVIFDGLYSISSHSRIKSHDRLVNTFVPKPGLRLHRGKMMGNFSNGKGYRYITLSVNSVSKNYYVHILTATHFCNNPLNLPEVNHLDGNKANNYYRNLEWTTKKGNMQHAKEIGLLIEGKDRKNAIKVINVKTLQVFDCIKHAADFYNIKYSLLKEGLGRQRKANCRKNHYYKDLCELSKWRID
jgi:hypothetical protein